MTFPSRHSPESLPTHSRHVAPVWNLDAIITQLAQPRSPQQLSWLQENHPVPLPSRDALFQMVDQLRAALFPFHFGKSVLGDTPTR